MNWKTYFDFLSEDDIRVKGTRAGIETILDDYLNASSPEEIVQRAIEHLRLSRYTRPSPIISTTG